MKYLLNPNPLRFDVVAVLTLKRETQRLRERTFRRAGEVLSEERARLRSRVEQAKRETMETLSEVRRLSKSTARRVPQSFGG